MAKKDEEFHQRLARIARERGVTQARIAEALRIDKSEVSRLFSGTRVPKPVDVAWLAAVLGVDAVTLAGGYTELFPEFDNVAVMADIAKRALDAEDQVRVFDADKEQLKADLERVVATVQKDFRSHIERIQAEADAREKTLRGQVEEQRKAVAGARTRIAMLKSALAANQQRIGELEEQLRRASGEKWAAGLLGGLAGVLGTALASAAVGSEDDDEEEYDE